MCSALRLTHRQDLPALLALVLHPQAASGVAADFLAHGAVIGNLWGDMGRKKQVKAHCSTEAACRPLGTPLCYCLSLETEQWPEQIGTHFLLTSMSHTGGALVMYCGPLAGSSYPPFGKTTPASLSLAVTVTTWQVTDRVAEVRSPWSPRHHCAPSLTELQEVCTLYRALPGFQCTPSKLRCPPAHTMQSSKVRLKEQSLTLTLSAGCVWSLSPSFFQRSTWH